MKTNQKLNYHWSDCMPNGNRVMGLELVHCILKFVLLSATETDWNNFHYLFVKCIFGEVKTFKDMRCVLSLNWIVELFLLDHVHWMICSIEGKPICLQCVYVCMGMWVCVWTTNHSLTGWKKFTLRHRERDTREIVYTDQLIHRDAIL